MKEKRNDYKLVFDQQEKFLLKSCSEFDLGDETEAIRIAGHLRTILHTSYIKKDFDTKLTSMILEIKELVGSENFNNKRKVLNKLNGLREKIEQQQRKQILSKSLLTQLKLIDKLNFIDTALPKNSFAFYTINGPTNTTIISKSYYGLLAKEINVNQEGIEILKYLPLCLHAKSESYFNRCSSIRFEDWWHKNIYNDGKGTEFSRKDLITIVANQDGYAHIEENINTKYQTFKEANILENFINSNKKEKINLATLNSVRQIAFEVLMTINTLN